MPTPSRSHRRAFHFYKSQELTFLPSVIEIRHLNGSEKTFGRFELVTPGASMIALRALKGRGTRCSCCSRAGTYLLPQPLKTACQAD